MLLALWGCSIVLIILAITSPDSPYTVIFLLCLTMTLVGGVYAGFLTNHIDLSPNFCGTLMGITNSLSSTTSILGPLTVGWIVSSNPVSPYSVNYGTCISKNKFQFLEIIIL